MSGKRRRNAHTGSSFESFLAEEGILEETQERAIKAVLAWQLEQRMKERGMSKKKMAEEMRTSRTQINRLLDPNNDAIALATLQKAARVLGMRIRLELVPAA